MHYYIVCKQTRDKAGQAAFHPIGGVSARCLDDAYRIAARVWQGTKVIIAPDPRDKADERRATGSVARAQAE